MGAPRLTSDDRATIAQRLNEAVTEAIPEGGSERDVVTFISRPLWAIYCDAMGIPPGTAPSTRYGVGESMSGSLTLIDSEEGLAARSVAREAALA